MGVVDSAEEDSAEVDWVAAACQIQQPEPPVLWWLAVLLQASHSRVRAAPWQPIETARPLVAARLLMDPPRGWRMTSDRSQSARR